MKETLKAIGLVTLKNAVNALLVNAAVMAAIPEAFHMHSRAGFINLAKLALTVIAAREGMIWLPKILKWSQTNAVPNGGEKT